LATSFIVYATDVDWWFIDTDRSVWYFDQANSQNCYKASLPLLKELN